MSLLQHRYLPTDLIEFVPDAAALFFLPPSFLLQLANRPPFLVNHPLQADEGGAALLPEMFGVCGRDPADPQFLLGLLPLVAIPLPQQMAQILRHLLIILGAMGLPFQRTQARLDFAQDVMHPLEIVLCLLQAAQSLRPAHLVMADTRRLFKQRPPLFGPQ